MYTTNPFAQLLGAGSRGSNISSEVTQERQLKRFYYTEDGSPTPLEYTVAGIEEHRYLSSVFLVTSTRLHITNPRVVPCVLLKDFEGEHKGALMSFDTLEDALLERLTNTYFERDVIYLGDRVAPKQTSVSHGEALESDPIRYLFGSYLRTVTVTVSRDAELAGWTDRCRKLIVNMFVSALNEAATGETAVFAGCAARSAHDVELLLAQLFDTIVLNDPQLATDFWTNVVNEVASQGSEAKANDESIIFKLFRETFGALKRRTQAALREGGSFGDLPRCIEQLNVLLSVPRLAAPFIRFQTPFTYYTYYVDAVEDSIASTSTSNTYVYMNRPGWVPTRRRGEKLSCAANVDGRFARFYEEETVFGAFLSQSCLPPSEYGPFEYFDQPTRVSTSDHVATERQIWTRSSNNHDLLYELFRKALAKRAAADRDGQTDADVDARAAMLGWMRAVLQANAAKTKLWSTTMPLGMLTPLHNASFATDAFFINLSAILLRFTEPMFTAKQNLVDLSFMASNLEKGQILGSCTFLLPISDDRDRAFVASVKRRAEELARSRDEAERTQATKSRLCTELFLYAHLSLQLGIRSLSDKFLQLNRHLHELDVRFREQHAGALEQLEPVTSTYLSEKATLTEPRMLALALRLAVSTASHIMAFSRFELPSAAQVDTITLGQATQLRRSCVDDFESEMSLMRREGTTKRSCLMLIPEVLVENVLETCKLVNRLSDDVFAEFDKESLSQLVEFGAFMMGSLGCCSNPHLRASLAELLATLLPTAQRNDSATASHFVVEFTLANALKDRVFAECNVVRRCLMRSLLTVFVSIELTSENVNFYQKLNYRHPMYAALRHVWRLHTTSALSPLDNDANNEDAPSWLSLEQREILHSSSNAYVRSLNLLAFEAIRSVHQPDAPLALRFANCLLNDANYLLDEALSALARIKVAERLADEQRTGVVAPPENDPPALPAAQAQGGLPRQNPAGRIEQQTNVAQLTQQARAYNQLGRETIACLAMLSEAAGMHAFMLHPILRDRVISMLNYFLAHLVGKRRRELAVKNKDAVDFNPRELVSSIAQVYIHLGIGPLSDNADVLAGADSQTLNDTFCSAVSQDAQSYSQDMLEETLKVLRLIEMPGSARIEAFRKVAIRVRELAEARKQEDSALENAPEEFVDPILGTLMRDPVVLPTSRVTVDRNTIARHLLSDQTDPFNRQPLTMEQCLPDESLRRRIDEWITQQCTAHSSN